MSNNSYLKGIDWFWSILLVAILVGLWFLLPILLKGVYEIGKLATFLVAIISAFITALSAFGTYRLKEQEVSRRIN